MLEKRNPGAAGTASGANIDPAKINTNNDTPIYPALQRRTAERLAARFGLTLAVALVVATLAGFGGLPS